MAETCLLLPTALERKSSAWPCPCPVPFPLGPSQVSDTGTILGGLETTGHVPLKGLSCPRLQVLIKEIPDVDPPQPWQRYEVCG